MNSTILTGLRLLLPLLRFGLRSLQVGNIGWSSRTAGPCSAIGKGQL